MFTRDVAYMLDTALQAHNVTAQSLSRSVLLSTLCDINQMDGVAALTD